MGRTKILESKVAVRVGKDLLVAVGVGSEQDVSLRSTDPALVGKAKLAARLRIRRTVFDTHGVAGEITAGYSTIEEIQAMLLSVSDQAILVPLE